jgi:Subtilase family/S-layer homology domain
MMNKLILIISSFIVSLIFFPIYGKAQSSESYIILFSKEVDHSLLQKAEVEVNHTFSLIPAVTVTATEQQLQVLKTGDDIVSITKDKPAELTQVKLVGYNEMKINTARETGVTGKGVKVAVIDTGVDTDHPDLRIAGGVCVLESFDCTNGFEDDNGHGTHVAGIISAQDNNIGILGVAPGVELYAVKALDASGYGSTVSIMKGIEWSIENGIDIINLSVSAKSNDPALHAIIDKAYSQGVLIVAAAGNEGKGVDVDSNNVLYPAKYDSVIAVGAIDQTLKKIPQSATGPEMEMVAFGGGIYSTYPSELDPDGTPDGYTYMSGTSMATPYITGLLALYKETYPYLSHVELRTFIQQTAQDLGEPGRDSFFGYGLGTYERPENIEGQKVYPEVSSDGKITFRFIKEANDDTFKIERDGQIIYQGAFMLNYIDYAVKGTYNYTFTFTDRDGGVRVEQVTVQVSSPAFKDVKPEDWYSPNLVYLYQRNILTGYPGNYIKPRSYITRGEAVALLGRALGLNGEKRPTVFKDVGGNYFASGYIQSAFDHGIISGFPDGTFRPDSPVTRAEMAILLANAYLLEDIHSDIAFSDVTENVTGYEQILKVATAGYTRGYPDGTFHPHESMTRYAFSVFLSRAENHHFLTR